MVIADWKKGKLIPIYQEKETFSLMKKIIGEKYGWKNLSRWLIVSDLDRSIAFYRDILRLEFQGEIFMEAEEQIK